MEYISAREASERWHVHIRVVQDYCKSGRISGARKYGVSWLIPADSKKPSDPRKAAKCPESKNRHLLPRRCPILAITDIYSKPGTADEVAASISNYPQARTLFLSVIAYARGQADLSAELSADLLSRTECFDTKLGCLINIANAELYRGDFNVWESARNEIVGIDCETAQEQAVKELMQVGVDVSIYDRRSTPKWFETGCFDPLPTDCYPCARHYYFKRHFIDSARVDLAYRMELLCSQTRAEGVVIAQIYLGLDAANVWFMYGEKERAAFHISRVLDLALPDRLYAPLAEHRRDTSPLMDELLRQRDADAYRRVLEIYERLIPAWTRIYQNRMKRVFAQELTLREFEALKYAALGRTNGEIAALMNVSTNTVRSYISSILSKTGLSNRNEFAGYIKLS
ncbi:MAG: LuxR C-terminal-related transcriptional regulator [Clostridia bacterium]|nr:LuxR C-terminal-related transcriptional regulator [Clostridia bacterium]